MYGIKTLSRFTVAPPGTKWSQNVTTKIFFFFKFRAFFYINRQIKHRQCGRSAPETSATLTVRKGYKDSSVYCMSCHVISGFLYPRTVLFSGYGGELLSDASQAVQHGVQSFFAQFHGDWRLAGAAAVALHAAIVLDLYTKNRSWFSFSPPA